MMAVLLIGALVCVGPNMRSLYQPDHREAEWTGRVIYETSSSYGVEPVDGRLPRDVLKERVTECDPIS